MDGVGEVDRFKDQLQARVEEFSFAGDVWKELWMNGYMGILDAKVGNSISVYITHFRMNTARARTREGSFTDPPPS
jgi:hypothetical protein